MAGDVTRSLVRAGVGFLCPHDPTFLAPCGHKVDEMLEDGRQRLARRLGRRSAPMTGGGAKRSADDAEAKPTYGLDRGLNASLRQLLSKPPDGRVHPLGVTEPSSPSLPVQLRERASSTRLLAQDGKNGQFALGDGKFVPLKMHPMLGEVNNKVPNPRCVLR